MPQTSIRLKKGIAAVVVSYRTGPVLERCLTALLADSGVTELVVVDNGNPLPERRLLDHLAAGDARVRVLRPGRNMGFAAACNWAAATSTAPVLAFVNPDLIVSPNVLSAAVEILDENPDAWLLGVKLVDQEGREQRGGRRETLTPWRAMVEVARLDRLLPNHPHFRRFNHLDQPPPHGVASVPAISGALMVTPRQRLEILGGFDERMFLHTEDLDLCLRVLQAGGKVFYAGALSVFHQGGSSDAYRIAVEWHKTRSTSYYFFKHFRQTYPAWALRLTSFLLWSRFLGISVLHGPADARRLLRRIAEARR